MELLVGMVVAISIPPPLVADDMTFTGLRGLFVGDDVSTSALREWDRLVCRYSPCVCSRLVGADVVAQIPTAKRTYLSVLACSDRLVMVAIVFDAYEAQHS